MTDEVALCPVTGKARYPNWVTAYRARRTIQNRRRRRGVRRERLDVYRCEFCHDIHLGRIEG